MACHECGGPAEDKRIRELMGCDKETKRPHRLMIGNDEEFLHTCPRKLMVEAIPYLKAHRWSAAGNLTHLYPIGTLPAKIGEAIDLLENEQAKRMRLERESK